MKTIHKKILKKLQNLPSARHFKHPHALFALILLLALSLPFTLIIVNKQQSQTTVKANLQSADATAIHPSILEIISFVEQYRNEVMTDSPTEESFSASSFSLQAQEEIAITTFDTGPIRPAGITSGPDGNIWFVGAVGNTIGKITPNGTITPYQALGNCLSDITSNLDGALWYTRGCTDKVIGRLNPDTGSITEFPTPSSPSRITSDKTGNLWYTSGQKVGKMTTSGLVTEYPVSGSPRDITADTEGNIWFIQFSGIRIGKITPNGVFTEYPVDTNGNLFGITWGPDSALWFTIPNPSDSQTIGRMTTNGSISKYHTNIGGSAFIANGPDGNLWFTKLWDYRIGTITPTGSVSHIPLPYNCIGASCLPHDITSGPDGNVWFTDIDANKVGRVNLAPATPECHTSPSGIDSCDPILQKGDILLLHATNVISITQAALFNGYWTHAGIYNGDGTVTESYPNPLFVGLNRNYAPGVINSSFNQSLFWNEDIKDWSILRVNSLDASKKANAVTYAKNKADGNHLYNYDFWDKQTESKFYCSQLVWKAYETQGVDLDSNFSAFSLFAKYWNTPFGLIGAIGLKDAVLPDDLYFSQDVSIVKRKELTSGNPWTLWLFSPAKLLVTDPQGRHAGYNPETKYTLQEIPDAFYGGFDREPQFINFTYMADGTWRFEVFGTNTGEYILVAEEIDKESHSMIQAQGMIMPGERVTYEFTKTNDDTKPALTQNVTIDIKPGDTDPAVINLKSKGVIPVAILSTNTFDAATIDPQTVKFGPKGAVSTRNSMEDVNKDGKKDLMQFFPTQHTGIGHSDTKACLTGKTKTNINIQGCGAIRITSY